MKFLWKNKIEDRIRFDRLRDKMVDEQLLPRGIKDERVLAAMRKVPRHLFVEEPFWDRAYGDHALPIGERQTISQPFMVARMTEILELKGTERILEIGTGSGYQTAVLAECCLKVYSIERIKPLAMKARDLLDELKYQNAVIKVFDGTYGWSDESPFDVIIVTAGSPGLPQPLIDQLKEGGRMAIPIGERRETQTLHKITKKSQGIEDLSLTPCVFVSLIGQYGWSDKKPDGMND